MVVIVALRFTSILSFTFKFNTESMGYDPSGSVLLFFGVMPTGKTPNERLHMLNDPRKKSYNQWMHMIGGVRVYWT
jgi:hypothetical protein